MAKQIYKITKVKEPEFEFEEWEIDADDIVDAMKQVIESEGYSIEIKDEQTGEFEQIRLS